MTKFAWSVGVLTIYRRARVAGPAWRGTALNVMSISVTRVLNHIISSLMGVAKDASTDVRNVSLEKIANNVTPNISMTSSLAGVSQIIMPVIS